MITWLLYQFLKHEPYRKSFITYKTRRISVELADTFAKRLVGLMYRDGMPKDVGMFFTFMNESVAGAAITMANMRFSLDLVWINSKGEIVDIAQRVPPCRSFFICKDYKPKEKAKYVLELAAGKAAEIGIKEEESVKLPSSLA